MSKPNNIRIYYQDDEVVVIDKPTGFQVHTPVHYAMEGKVVRKNNVLILLRKQLEKEIFTVHRLDKATSGVMIYALSSSVAAKLQKQFIEKQIRKTYVCLVRGWTNDCGVIDKPLTKNLDDGSLLDSVTEYETLIRFEVPYSTGRYEKERYSIVKVNPLTGRLHQIRRHFRSISHPLVGDTIHGDGKHNRLWRELMGSISLMPNHLFLKAYSLEFKHPESGSPMKFRTLWNKPWLKMFEIAGQCPILDE
jgi:tRNA pseudouridine65 synthase